MKATDLMIGDWVCVNGLTQQVFDLAYNQNEKELTIGVLDPQGDVYQCFYGFDNVESIPLTAEILEGNGFDVMVYDNGDKLFAYGSLCILEHKGLLTFKISDCRKKISHVHELQHVLKLCGIEKEIEL